MQKGNINVQAENIFPIIKQFLYSDQEIFLRELVSNAVDATSKLRTLANRGEIKGEIGETRIEIILNTEEKTLTIRDRGIGMTEEEVGKYLNQVAFSSAQEFVEKYQNDASIIGHFGLGFYSAFMVADKVDVVTKSWKSMDNATRWICEGNPEYEIGAGEREMRGTDVVLHISDDSKEFLEESRISELLNKYCKFLPVEIKFGTKTETSYEGEGEEKEEVKTEVDNIVNNPNPLWKKAPKDMTDEDYRAFYSELYPFSAPPEFWIHLNIDFPFNLTGILYFPKMSNSPELQRNKIQLYSNQVYVTDDVKEIVPEWLTLLHGVIDSPDIPLNVSRSYLQSDSNVRKITGYITKKVADTLKDLYKKDRANFEAKWKDLGVFVKYGMLSDEKFYDKAQKFALLQNVDANFFTIEEYKEKVKTEQTNKDSKVVMLYTNEAENHDSFITAAKNRGYDVLVFDNVLDNHFMQQLESKLGDVTFVRVDSSTADNLVEKDEKKESVLSDDDQAKVTATFTSIVTGPGASVNLEPMAPDDQPVVITRPEFLRRMKEMQAMGGGGMMMMGDMPDAYNVTVNSNHPIITDKLLKTEDEAQKTELATYLVNLAKLNQGMLKGADLTKFVEKSLGFLR